MAKHTAAREIISPISGDEGAAWDFLIDDPDDGEFWQAKFDFWKCHKSIEEATAAGITVKEYMKFFHPDRN